MTVKKPPTKRKLVRQTAGPVDKRRRKRGLTVTVKVAIDAMVFDRCTRAEACQRAGFAERSLYLALEKPEVAAYWNRCVEVLRTGERAANVHRLVAIRDKAENIPAVQAIKTLIELDAEAAGRPAASAPSPYVTIRLISENVPAPRIVDVTPAVSFDSPIIPASPAIPFRDGRAPIPAPPEPPPAEPIFRPDPPFRRR